jgi:hypothetical protein
VHAEAGGHELLAAVELHGRPQRAGQAIRDPPRGGCAARAPDHDRELVAAEAGDDVAGSQQAPHPLGQHHEQAIARPVAEGVVDQLEVVQIDE